VREGGGRARAGGGGDLGVVDVRGCGAGKRGDDLGCDGLMVLPPYVYKGDWREMKAHVAAVFNATPLACMLYNNPVAYGTDFLPEQIRELAAEHENLAAVKESSTDVRRVSAIRALLGSDRRLEICVGVDDAVLEAIGVGATGWIAGLANALPRESVELFNNGINGEKRQGVRVVSMVPAVAAYGHGSEFRSTDQVGAGGSGDWEFAGAAAAARVGGEGTRTQQENHSCDALQSRPQPVGSLALHGGKE
jgi:hypothetical protein